MKHFFAPNEGKTDRIIRGLLGLAGGVGAYFLTGWMQIGLGVVSFMMIFTAITGFCGLYKLIGINTCPLPKK